jgi:hypothetical protein
LNHHLGKTVVITPIKSFSAILGQRFNQPLASGQTSANCSVVIFSSPEHCDVALNAKERASQRFVYPVDLLRPGTSAEAASNAALNLQ